MATGSTRIILIALGANAAIAVAKFAAFMWTGSSAMLSEAVHSAADTSNQGLLLVGQSRARRPADSRHPFGYARELYFWSFVVAILLFSLGAGVSIYEGVEKLLHPHPISNPEVNYAVLIFAMVFEGYAIRAAIKEYNHRHRGQPVFSTLRSSKDPALFTILLEDAAALSGLTVAFIGILLAHLAGWEAADGIASVIIGVILAFVAAFIAIEVKGLLIGEAATPEVRAGIERILKDGTASDGQIRGINELRTMQLGANDILVAASVDLDDDMSAAEVKDLTIRLETAIKSAYPDVRKFYIEVQSRADHEAMAAAEAQSMA